MNAGKTKAMIFSNRCVPANLMDIVIDGVVVEVVNSLRFLGVHVDDRLCFSAHTASICSKISKSIGIFHKLKDYVPLDCLRNLYFSFIFPFVIYCNLIWGGTFKRYIDPIHLLQKKVIRIMNNAEYLAHTNCLFYKSEILNVFDIHKFILCNFVHSRIIDGNIPISLQPINTRSRGLPLPSNRRLTSIRRSPYYNGVILYNSIPNTIKSSNSSSIFKRSLKSLFIEDYNALEH